MNGILRHHNAWGAAASFWAAQHKASGRNMLFIVPDNKVAFDTAVSELKLFTDNKIEVLEFPPYAMGVFEEARPLADIMARRSHTLFEINHGKNFIIVTTPYALLKTIPSKADFESSIINIAKNSAYPLHRLNNDLNKAGYVQVEFVNAPGEFTIRGGIADVFPISADYPLRIEFFDEEMENIFFYNPESQLKVEHVDRWTILPASDLLVTTEDFAYMLENEQAKQKAESYGKFAGYHWWSPLLGVDHATLKDYLSDDIQVVSRLAQPKEDCKKILEEAADIITKNSLPGEFILNFANIASIVEFLENENSAIITETAETIKSIALDYASSKVKFTYEKINIYQSMKRAMEIIGEYLEKDYKIVISVESDRFANIFKEFARDYDVSPVNIEHLLEIKSSGVYLYHRHVSGGFIDDDAKLAIVSDQDIFGFSKRKPKHKKKEVFNTTLADLEEGDYVVHVQHGIGVYRGIKHLTIAGVEGDFLDILYDGDDVLYVPLQSITQLQKYIGLQDHKPALSSLKTSAWSKLKRHAKESAKTIAEDLLRLYAERKAKKGFAFHDNGEMIELFERDFEYTETEDQLTAIIDVYKDMESETPMERLICGDVGFGKTEVAMRSACKAAACGKQTAVLAPTTILVRQHYETFKRRFANLPVNIDYVSRFRTPKDVKNIFDKVSKGQVDILIGTHKLLSKELAFKDLGLLVIDEEQRFGVSHKEKIASIKRNVDTLTLSATPIPRTLQLSLSGIRDMSIIETPPENRLPVIVKVITTSSDTEIAIKNELERGGQVFFLHNKVMDIDNIAAEIKSLVPHARVGFAHGQMEAASLEKILQAFYAGKIDVLVSTTIIENGVDIPNVNTMIINDAGRFGLSQLYQLKGRVGRSNRRGYCHLLVKNFSSLTPVAQKRLTIIQQLADLGSGFKIAMYDLQLRGAGNILGAEQSGFVVRIGYELYVKMIEEAVAEMKGDFKTVQDTEINSNIPYFIPATFVENPRERFEYYRRFSQITDLEQMKELFNEFEAGCGELPQEITNLGYIMLIKNTAGNLGAAKVTLFQGGAKITFVADAKINPQIIAETAAEKKVRYRFASEYELMLSFPDGNMTGAFADFLLYMDNRIQKITAGDANL